LEIGEHVGEVTELDGAWVHRGDVALACGAPRRLGDVGELAESGGVVDRHLGEHLPVDVHRGALEPRDELAVRHAVHAGGGIDARDPQLAEAPLLDATVTVGVDAGALDGLARAAVHGATAAEVPLRLLEDLLAFGAAGYCIFCAWHDNS